MLMANFRGLQGTAIVETFQRALANLAIATARPTINPGPVTGVLNDSTMVAFSAAIGVVAEELPDWLYLLLQAAMAGGATSTAAKNFVTKYAAPLTIALNTAAVKYKAAPVVTIVQPTPGPLDTLFAPGWYTRPSLGLLVVGVGAFAIYKLLAPAPRAAA